MTELLCANHRTLLACKPGLLLVCVQQSLFFLPSRVGALSELVIPRLSDHRMLLLVGPSIYPESRLKALQKQVQALVPQIASLDAIFIHLVLTPSADAERILSSDKSEYKKTLDSILAYGDDVARPETRQICGSAAENGVYVLPRPGSISPWSSKATDIARMCHLGDYVQRVERGVYFHATTANGSSLSESDWKCISHLLHDRMTQILQPKPPVESDIVFVSQPRPLRTIPLSNLPSDKAKRALREANVALGLALTEDEVDYLISAYVSDPDAIGRDPTDAELFMFAQVNSEHCRHKIFNANWTIDGVQQEKSLFDMIRNTERSIQGKHTISAYSDNAAVFEGYEAPRFAPGPGNVYASVKEHMPVLIKVETHNHPTAVSPFPGAATGSGGEIRDEGAVGRGSKPKAGLAGFTVSNLLIPDYLRPWETDFGKPAHIASSLDIMIEGPLGAAAFNNEFGRPALAGKHRIFLRLDGILTNLQGISAPFQRPLTFREQRGTSEGTTNQL
jgi:phosphoribosylformylglycinamidine synthase